MVKSGIKFLGEYFYQTSCTHGESKERTEPRQVCSSLVKFRAPGDRWALLFPNWSFHALQLGCICVAIYTSIPGSNSLRKSSCCSIFQRGAIFWFNLVLLCGFATFSHRLGWLQFGLLVEVKHIFSPFCFWSFLIWLDGSDDLRRLWLRFKSTWKSLVISASTTSWASPRCNRKGALYSPQTPVIQFLPFSILNLIRRAHLQTYEPRISGF